MKRAQSVEVLSILSSTNSSSATASTADAPKPVYTESFLEPTLEARPPSVSPPPLPPRESRAEPPTPPPVNHVLSSNPALVNENIVISSAAGSTTNSPSLPAKKAFSSKPAALRSNKPIPSFTTTNNKQSRSTNIKSSPVSVAVETTKPTSMKPVSPGLLFGVKERELPAPDTVRETRKLFEANNGGSRATRKISGGGLTKSKSTSSLYTKPGSRSSSIEARSPARGSPARRRGGAIGSSPRRISESSGGYKMAGGGDAGQLSSSRPAGNDNESVSKRSASNLTKSRETPIERLKSGPGLRTCDRPAIPVKPTHLSPIVANNFKRSPSDLRPKLNPVTNKINNTQSTVITEAKNGHLAGTAGMSPSVTSSNKKTEISEVENVRLNLHPVSNNTTPTTPANNNSKIHSDLAVSAKRPQSPFLEDEDGVKRISADSIQNIRRDGNVMSFQFTSAPASGLSHLPGAKIKTGSAAVGARHQNQDAKQPELNKKVCVIKPISRDVEKLTAITTTNPAPSVKLSSGVGSSQVKKDSSTFGRSKGDTRSADGGRAVIVKSDSTNNNVDNGRQLTFKNTQKTTSSVTNSRTQSTKNKQESPKPSGDQSSSKKSTTKPVITSTKSPPTIPPRNGSKLETVPHPKKYFDSNIEEHAPTSPKTVNGTKSLVDEVDKKSEQKAVNGSYPLKSRSDAQNSLVFNFVNTKKDTSHLEYDGLDLSNRKNKKNGVVYLDQNGETATESISDDETAEHMLNFVFVGANIVTGKSSIRTKPSAKKLNITWKAETEVFEYPSFESSKDGAEEDSGSRGNSTSGKPIQSMKTNTSVKNNSSGGLGSYQPSKIQMSDAPFQLGVSRTSTGQPATSSTSAGHVATPSKGPPSPPLESCLRPTDEGISWGSSASSDMLF